MSQRDQKLHGVPLPQETGSAIRRAGFALALVAVTLFSSSGQLIKYVGPWGTAAYGLLLLFATFVAAGNRLDWLWRKALLRNIFWFALIFATFALFALLFPLSHSGRFGAGSDRDEALNLALNALLHHHYPYYAVTHFGNPITPMPGALLLALPFYLIGTAALQNLFWGPAFLLFCRHAFQFEKQAFTFAILCVFANTAFLQDFGTGGDYAINIFYVTMAAAFLHLRLMKDASWRPLLFAAALLGVTLASRPVWCLILPVLFFQGIRRGVSLKAFLACAVAGAMCLILVVPFYLHDPAHFSPLHVAGLAQSAIPYGAVLLPALALLIAPLALLLPTDRYHLFGLSALMLALLFLPPIVASFSTFNIVTVVRLGYGYPITLWAGFWLASRPSFISRPASA